MQDRTINNALLALRVQIVRADREGLEHVRALLRLRRVLMPEVKHAPRQAFKRRELAALLRDGPMSCREMSDRSQEARGFTRRPAQDTVDNTLARMKRAGRVKLEGGLWTLEAPSLSREPQPHSEHLDEKMEEKRRLLSHARA